LDRRKEEAVVSREAGAGGVMTETIKIEIDCEMDHCGRCRHNVRTVSGESGFCVIFGSTTVDGGHVIRHQDCLDAEVVWPIEEE
jgi:hypothetical protein